MCSIKLAKNPQSSKHNPCLVWRSLYLLALTTFVRLDKDTPRHADGPGGAGAALATCLASHVTRTQWTRDPPQAAETESARA